MCSMCMVAHFQTVQSVLTHYVMMRKKRSYDDAFSLEEFADCLQNIQELHTTLQSIKRRGAFKRVLWTESTPYYIFYEWPDDVFRKRMRMSRSLATMISTSLIAGGFFKDNDCANPRSRLTAEYKIWCCLYYLAHGGNYTFIADNCGISETQMSIWLKSFALGVITTLAPIYFRDPTPAEL